MAAFLISAALILPSLSSCKKDSPKSKTAFLTKANWKIVKSESRAGTGAWVDHTSSVPCEIDDYVVFRTNGTYESNEGATKCSPGDPQIIETGTWAFMTNETQLATTPSGSTALVIDINQLDENTLVVVLSFSNGGVTYYDRTTFGH